MGARREAGAGSRGAAGEESRGGERGGEIEAQREREALGAGRRGRRTVKERRTATVKLETATAAGPYPSNTSNEASPLTAGVKRSSNVPLHDA